MCVNNEYTQSQAHQMSEYQLLEDHNGKDVEGCADLEQGYTNEQVALVSKILASHNYFDILGVGQDICDREEIDNAYKKLSEKVHPDNNKAPGSDEAFKKVMEAYECLSHTGKHLRYVFMARMYPDEPSAIEVVLWSLLFLGILYSVVSPWSDSLPVHPYFLEVDNIYDFKSPMMTKEYGIEYYVKSSAEFDEKYPVGTIARTDIENKVIDDYISLVQQCCSDELRWNLKRREFPTLMCDKLQTLRTHTRSLAH